LIALVALAAAAPAAQAHTVPAQQPFRVLIIDHLRLADLERLQKRGGVGLLVPGVGPRTNRRRALAALLRGQMVNARLGGVPRGPQLIAANAATGIPTGHPEIVLALPPRGAPVLNDRRYPVAILGRGCHGLLESPTTRIPGLVSIIDIAPTVLGHRNGSLSCSSTPHAEATARSLDRRIAANNALKLPSLFVVAGVVVLLALVRPRAALAAPPAALLATLLLGAIGLANPAVLGVGLGLLTLGGALLLGRLCRSTTALLALFAGTILVYLVALSAAPTWVAINPLGPTQNSRFYGVGNQMETLLLVPALLGAALAGRRFGVPGFVAFAALVLVTVAENDLGSDAGGAVVLGVGFAVLAARLARLRLRGLVIALALSGAAVATLVSWDLHRGGPNHLRSVFGHGSEGLLAVARNRFPLAYEPALHQWYLTAELAAAFVLVAVVAIARRHPPGRRAVLEALVVSVVTSLLVNDSAAYVLLGGATCLVAAARPAIAYAPLRRFSLAARLVPRVPPQPAPEPAASYSPSRR
jgi:hypothetical protein